jgi:hypothetical protein
MKSFSSWIPTNLHSGSSEGSRAEVASSGDVLEIRGIYHHDFVKNMWLCALVEACSIDLDALCLQANIVVLIEEVVHLRSVLA